MTSAREVAPRLERCVFQSYQGGGISEPGEKRSNKNLDVVRKGELGVIWTNGLVKEPRKAEVVRWGSTFRMC